MSIYGMNVDFKVDSFADYMKQMASAEKNIASEIIYCEVVSASFRNEDCTAYRQWASSDAA